MHKRIGGLAFAIVMAASLATASAAETYSLYSCTFIVRGEGSEKREIFIGVDAAGKAFTYDTKPGSDDPVRMPVKVSKDGPDHFVYTYSFTVPNVDGRDARFDMRVRIPKQGGKSRISWRARGYYGSDGGDGTCKLERNVRLP